MKLFSGRAFIVILAICQGLGLIIGKILLLTGALVSQKLTTYPSLVTLPVALIVVGAALCIFWIPHIARKIGIYLVALLALSGQHCQLMPRSFILFGYYA